MSELLWKDVPADRVGDVDYIVELLDWERNVDPDFWTSNMMVPVETRASAASGDGWTERWVVYLATEFSAKELTVLPGRTVTVRDARRLRLHRGRGLRHPERPHDRLADDDPLRPADRGRVLRVRGRRPATA